MKRVVVFKDHYGRWVSGIELHPLAVSTHATWLEAMAEVPAYLAIARQEPA